MADELWDAATLADYLGRSVRSVHDARHRGGDVPPMFKVGGRLVAYQTDVFDWLDAKRDDAIAEMKRRDEAMRRAISRPSLSPNPRRPNSERLPAVESKSSLSRNTALNEVRCAEL